MTDIPHFSLPFRFSNPSAAVNEQDSIDEIADAVLAVLICPVGFRVELPSFGLQDQTFAPAPDLDAIRDAIDTWEPRAAAILNEYPDAYDELIARVEVDVAIRSED